MDVIMVKGTGFSFVAFSWQILLRAQKKGFGFMRD
jgi:hypothetical protein